MARPKSTKRRKPQPLSRGDELMLVVILVLGENAYSTTILAELLARAGKKVTVGSLWVTLDQLAKRETILKVPIEREGNAGGRPRVFYRITQLGITKLKQVQAFQTRVWKDVPDLKEYED